MLAITHILLFVYKTQDYKTYVAFSYKTSTIILTNLILNYTWKNIRHEKH
jgi:hypothetical protein